MDWLIAAKSNAKFSADAVRTASCAVRFVVVLGAVECSDLESRIELDKNSDSD